MKANIQTSIGRITIELFDKEAPITVKNFVSYVEEGFYNDTIFHRVIKDFMVQCGGFNTDFEEKETNDPIKNEADNGLSNKTGTLAMARTQIVDSATAQFFINVKDNNFLDHKGKSDANYGYCVFASVTDGMDVINDIQEAATDNRGHHQDVPMDDIIIEEITLLDE